MVCEELTQDIYVGRQPILDRSNSTYAYELLFRSGQVNVASIDCELNATARVITGVFNELGLDKALGESFGFINVSESMLMSEAIEWLPPDKIVIEILETVRPTPEVVARTRELVRRGFRIALDDVLDLDEAFRPLIELATFIKIDLLGVPAGQLADVVARFRPFKARLLAEKVDSEEQAALCRDLGFDYFQGYYFARPSILSTRGLTAAESTLLRLLGLVLTDADVTLMEPVVKQDPALLLNLMRMSNSVGCGSKRQISTVREAITLLGRQQLQRWLQLLLFCANPNTPPSLLEMAATRARTMELLVESHGGRHMDAESAFLTGILSLLPALLRLPMEEVLKTLTVEASIRDALLKGDGALGRLLLLVQHWEHNDLSAFAGAFDVLPGLTMDDFNRASCEAMAWAAALSTPRIQ
ncbi:EAL and HDOD domain-containing protein [Methyloversatilis thermotolerans]|uniref:EAL and HDOD domain-containing protein n=1 Tax=Methyloversatilis thermotolerans TaxID=1346290 RepID=UPI0003809899|nr:EAL domain-containing protein [Methyloversatilis thermotolerans]